MNTENKCPKCNSENTYSDGNLWVCPDCFHEWDPAEASQSAQEESPTDIYKDANGVILSHGDTVSLIKDLKLKGFQSSIKSGTKVKGIRLVESNDGHNILCKIDGIGAMYLKSEFVKKI